MVGLTLPKPPGYRCQTNILLLAEFPKPRAPYAKTVARDERGMQKNLGEELTSARSATYRKKHVLPWTIIG